MVKISLDFDSNESWKFAFYPGKEGCDFNYEYTVINSINVPNMDIHGLIQVEFH